jgi:hypothetical protein
MNAELIIQFLSIVAVVVVGLVLSKQIKSQSELLQEYREYIKTMSWKEVRDKYEQYKIPEIKGDYEKQIKEQAKLYQKGAYQAIDKAHSVRNEAISVAALFYLRLSEEGRQEFGRDFPKVAPSVKALVAGIEPQTPGHLNTFPKKDHPSNTVE